MIFGMLAVAILSMSVPVWMFALAVIALIALRHAPWILRKQARLAVTLYRRTGWNWLLNLGPSNYLLSAAGLMSVSGAAVGPNETIASTTRLANLEAVNFLGSNSTNPALVQSAINLGGATVYSTTAPPIVVPPGPVGGTAVGSFANISGSTVLAATLALPLAGAPSVGGQDGTVLVLFNDTAAKAHTITTPANGVQASLHVITMSSTSSTFSAIVLVAYKGSWWVVSNYNCTLS